MKRLAPKGLQSAAQGTQRQGDRGEMDAVAVKPPKSKTRNNRFRPDWEYADKQIQALQSCGTQVVRFRHQAPNCGALIYVPTHCDIRACQRCGRRRSARELAKYKDQILQFAKPAMLTFTVPNAKDAAELCERLETLTKGFERLRRQKCWPKTARGVWSLEITWSAEKGYHPHLHVIADFPWLEHLDYIVQAWQELTGAKHHVDITRPRTQAEREQLPHEGMKYITKAWELDDDALRTILAVMGRRRMFNPFGGLRAAKEDQGETEAGACCPGCGSDLKWCYQNMERVPMDLGIAEKDAERSRVEGYPIFRGWWYSDRDDSPPPRPVT